MAASVHTVCIVKIDDATASCYDVTFQKLSNGVRVTWVYSTPLFEVTRESRRVSRAKANAWYKMYKSKGFAIYDVDMH